MDRHSIYEACTSVSVAHWSGTTTQGDVRTSLLRVVLAITRLNDLDFHALLKVY